MRLKEQEELARLDQSERTEQKSERKEYVPENETDGDVDLKPYLDPLLLKIGSDRVNFSQPVTNIAFGERTLHVCGTRLWNALNHEGWRNREAAS